MNNKVPSGKLILLAVLPGILLGLAWPPMPLVALSFIAFMPFLYLEDLISRHPLRNPRHFMLWCSLMVLVWNLAVAWWMFNGPVLPAAMVILTNTILLSLPFYGFHVTKKQFGDSVGYAAFIIYVLGVEYFHFNWQIHWPWLTLGHSWAMFPDAIQWYELTGVQGGSLWVLCSNVFIYLAIKNFGKAALWIQNRWQLKSSSVSILAILWVSIRPLLWVLIPLSIAPIFTFGAFWVKGAHDKEVLLVQPNIDTYSQKFEKGNEDSILTHLLELSSLDEQQDPPSLVVWPETAVPGYVWEGSWSGSAHFDRVVETVKTSGVPLLAGMVTRDTVSDKHAYSHYFEDGTCCFEAYNSALLITLDTIQVYHKAKLVAGSEYTPYPFLFGFYNAGWGLPGSDVISYSPGYSFNSLSSENSMSLVPAICFESVFSDHITQFIKEESQVITIITNDGWWGNTPGAQQHLYMAVLRAIENRRYVIRVANTGVSAIIDVTGKIRDIIPYGEEGVLIGKVQGRRGLTFYSKHGNYIGRVAAGIAVFFLLATFVKRRTHPK